MSERNDTGHDNVGTGPQDADRTIQSEVEDRAEFLEKNFNLSPETARVTAKDTVASRMRSPASDEIENARVDAAQASGAAEESER